METNSPPPAKGLHPTCRIGGECCVDPCGPTYLHEAGTEPTEAVDIPGEENSVEPTELGKLRSLGKRIMATLA